MADRPFANISRDGDDPEAFLDQLLAMPEEVEVPRPRTQKLPMARVADVRRPPAQHDKQGVPVDVLRAHDASVVGRTVRVFIVLTVAEADAVGGLWSNDPNTANALAKIRLASQVR